MFSGVSSTMRILGFLSTCAIFSLPTHLYPAFRLWSSRFPKRCPYQNFRLASPIVGIPHELRNSPSVPSALQGGSWPPPHRSPEVELFPEAVISPPLYP